MSSDTKLLEALDTTSFSAWQDRISLVPGRRDQARQRAAKQLEPESVAVLHRPQQRSRRTEISTPISTDLRAQVQPHLEASKTVII